MSIETYVVDKITLRITMIRISFKISHLITSDLLFSIAPVNSKDMNATALVPFARNNSLSYCFISSKPKKKNKPQNTIRVLKQTHQIETQIWMSCIELNPPRNI